MDIVNKKLISKLTLTWDGYGTPPKEITVESQLFTLDKVEKSKEYTRTLLTTKLMEPFKSGFNTTVLVTFDNALIGLSKNNNVCVTFNIIDSETGDYLTKTNSNLSEAYQVLINYGKN